MVRKNPRAGRREQGEEARARRDEALVQRRERPAGQVRSNGDERRGDYAGAARRTAWLAVLPRDRELSVNVLVAE